MKTVIRNSYTPQVGDYCDTVVIDKESGIKYVFDCDGVYTEFTRGLTITSLEDYREKYKDTDVFSTGVVKEKFGSIDAIDESLQTQIDDIKAASDVVDIVGTYADLQNYDTSKLNDNDIIKVLADETHDGDITYYRWSTSAQSFTYIGSITFDTQLSFTSTNPMENQGIAHSIYTEGTGANAGKDLGIDLNFINPVPLTYVNIGTQDTSTRGQKSIAIGLDSKATGENSTAIGFHNTASAINTVALGYDNTVSGQDSVSVGFHNTATNQDGVAIGFSVNATGNYGSLAAGSSGTTASAQWTTAIGHGYVQASANYATAIGNSGVTASGQMATALGSSAVAEGEYSVAIGRGVYAYNNYDLALGYSASTKSGNNAAVAIGGLAQAQGNYSIALGYATGVSPASGTTADNTIAIGHSVYPAKDNMISIGSNIYGGEAGGVAIGANTAARGTDSVALGKGSVASVANTVSVGDGSAATPLYRRIMNVDDAVDAHDAITKSQLDTATAVMTGATSSTTGTKGLVPAPAAGDQGKFLKGDGTWASTEMAILSYGSSTWQDFLDAYNTNSIVYCRASSGADPGSGTQGRMAFMAYVNNATNPTEVEFQYVRSVSSKTSSQPVDQVFVYKLTNANGGTWTVESRNMAPKLAQGTNTTVSYSSGTYTVSATDTTYSAFTGATSSADGAAGLVPKPLIADKDKYLKGDGTWETVQSGQDALIIREWS